VKIGPNFGRQGRPITGVKVDGFRIRPNTGRTMDVGVQVISSAGGFYRVYVEDAEDAAIDLTTRSNVALGFPNSFDNVFQQCWLDCKDTDGTPLRLHSHEGIGCSRNLFLQGFAQYDSEGDGHGIHLKKCDSNTFIEFDVSAVGEGSRGGIFLDNTSGGGVFPQNNMFYGCATVGGIVLSPASATGPSRKNWFYNYSTKDGEPIGSNPNSPFLIPSWACGITDEGEMFGAPFAHVRCFASTTQSVASGVLTKIALDSENYDNAVMHANGSNNTRITVPGNGVLQIGGSVRFQSNSGGHRELRIIRNGNNSDIVARDVRGAVNGASTEFTVSTNYKASPGDYFELQAYQNSGSSLAVSFQRFWACMASGTHF